LPLRLLLLITFFTATQARAQDPTQTAVQRDRDEERELGWSNVADFSFVLTSGNSSTSTLSVDDKLVRAWENAELSIRGGALRVRTTDDRFAIGTENDFEVIEDTTRDLDNERYYIFGRYDRDITDRFFWVAGGGWDRDGNAGIDSRSIIWGGLGNTWKDDEHIKFKTDYGITFTHRVDEILDPERDENYSEARLAWDYAHKFPGNTQFDSDFVYYLNLSNVDDYRFNTLNSVTTNLSSVFALRFGLQFLYQSLPAFEEIDLFPFEGGAQTGVAVVRKKRLDSVVKFSVVMTF
jgi:putative salt-induced outer membrane protein YdiY